MISTIKVGYAGFKYVNVICVCHIDKIITKIVPINKFEFLTLVTMHVVLKLYVFFRAGCWILHVALY